jgi:hypothetical protein
VWDELAKQNAEWFAARQDALVQRVRGAGWHASPGAAAASLCKPAGKVCRAPGV